MFLVYNTINFCCKILFPYTRIFDCENEITIMSTRVMRQLNDRFVLRLYLSNFSRDSSPGEEKTPSCLYVGYPSPARGRARSKNAVLRREFARGLSRRELGRERTGMGKRGSWSADPRQGLRSSVTIERPSGRSGEIPDQTQRRLSLDEAEARARAR